MSHQIGGGKGSSLNTVEKHYELSDNGNDMASNPPPVAIIRDTGETSGLSTGRGGDAGKRRKGVEYTVKNIGAGGHT